MCANIGTLLNFVPITDINKFTISVADIFTDLIIGTPLLLSTTVLNDYIRAKDISYNKYAIYRQSRVCVSQSCHTYYPLCGYKELNKLDDSKNFQFKKGIGIKSEKIMETR